MASPALAAEVDVTVVLRAPNGEALTDCDKFVDDNPGKGCEPGKTVAFTVGRAIVGLVNRPDTDASGRSTDLKVSEIARRGHLIDKVSAVAMPSLPLASGVSHVVDLEPWEQDLIDSKLEKSGLPSYTASQIYRVVHPPVAPDGKKAK